MAHNNIRKTICQFRLLAFLALILGIWLVVALSRDLWQLLNKKDRIEKMIVKKENLLTENQGLKEKLNYVESEEFVEKEAREKLNMAKEGETIVVLPEKITVADPRTSRPAAENLPNWQQWLNLFF